MLPKDELNIDPVVDFILLQCLDGHQGVLQVHNCALKTQRVRRYHSALGLLCLFLLLLLSLRLLLLRTLSCELLLNELSLLLFHTIDLLLLISADFITESDCRVTLGSQEEATVLGRLGRLGIDALACILSHIP